MTYFTGKIGIMQVILICHFCGQGEEDEFRRKRDYSGILRSKRRYPGVGRNPLEYSD